jgi:hypothetical protein
MTTQPIASSRPGPRVPGAARHRRIRAAAGTATITALIASGGYLTTTTTGPDPTRPSPTTGTKVNPSAQTLRDMLQSVASQYGSRPAADAVVNPSAQTLRDMHQSIAGQYDSQAVANATVHPNAQVRRELRESIAGQYGPAR